MWGLKGRGQDALLPFPSRPWWLELAAGSRMQHRMPNAMGSRTTTYSVARYLVTKVIAGSLYLLIRYGMGVQNEVALSVIAVTLFVAAAVVARAWGVGEAR